MSEIDIEKTRKDVVEGVDEILNGVKVDDIRAEGITVRIGGKLVKLEVCEEQLTDEETIRREMIAKFNEKLSAIRDYINDKAMEIENVISTYRDDYERKERELEKRLADANIMPGINREHAAKGLSIVSAGEDSYLWIYRTTYKPTRYNGKPLDPKFARKMITPVVIEIKTKGKNVANVSVKRYLGNGNFHHYHSGCWGEWRYSNEKWETPDDIIRIADYAIGILDNINGESPADHSPTGLPRITTVRKHVLSDTRHSAEVKSVRRKDERAGLNEDVSDGWTT